MIFRDKIVLITGGSSGIGAACAQEFGRLGARISILDRIDPTCCDPAIATVGDITDAATRERAVSGTLDRFGAIDILVNSVGVGLYEPVSRSRPGDEYLLFNTNVFSAIAVSQLVIPHMKRRREGSIANISSVGAYSGLPWSAAYCSSKSALHSYSESMRRELRSCEIHVSTIVPGIVETGFRERVIGGVAPRGVLSISRSVSARDVAACVARAVFKRKRRVFIPWYGQVFAALDLFLPALMDAYMNSKWSAEDAVADVHSARNTLPAQGGALHARRETRVQRTGDADPEAQAGV